MLLILSAVTVDDTQDVGSLTGVQAEMARYLLDKGYNKAQTAAIIANAQAESGCNPTSDENMPDVAFLVTSSTTGESHVVVSDENGLVDTANSWAAHDASTNTSDDAVTITKDGTSYTLAEASVAGIKGGDDGVTYTVDDAKLSSAAGIWFSGSTTTSTTADDSLGALPYDTYTVTELRCGSNVGHSTISFTLVAHRDGHAGRLRHFSAFSSRFAA